MQAAAALAIAEELIRAAPEQSYQGNNPLHQHYVHQSFAAHFLLQIR
jgi:hypothetical protein